MIRKNNKRFVTVIMGLIAVVMLVLLAACSGGAKTTLVTTQPAATKVAAGSPVTIQLTASGMAFDTNKISVPAGAQVTVNFTNNDSGVQHNLAVYTDSTASKSIYVGSIIKGVSSVTYPFTAPAAAGTYFFRCDVHPTSMTGQFIVQ